MNTFPEIAAPNISSASNCSESFTENIADSTISTTTDANYKITRPRTTKMISTWSFSWVALSDDDYALLKTFWKQVGKFAPFSWTNPIDGQSYVVRFSGDFSFQHNHPAGWQGTLKFEEV
ncbi:hypothetical protein [Pectinatus frisingensis]|uniref:hypothetical protein n=1 Tax=Pectinatus frisingensis TaxID=865 RepID=UPI0018C46195|nr:hypothetical protein [Pectinatus frisingensis]